MSDTNPQKVTSFKCSKCLIEKTSIEFYRHGKICCNCNNEKRREQYKNNEEHRKKLIKQVTEFKHNKVLERQKIREAEQQAIGIENKQCKYCNEIKNKDRFRHNRLKCKDCERDDPVEKFKRYVRTRIYNCLRNKNKTKHSVEYLGCAPVEYLKWMLNHNENYNLDNYGEVWHIDHIIPLSKFNLDDEIQQLIAFNWRNTMPLSASENLSKNNRIIPEQVKTHYEKLKKYHQENKLELPQVYIDLFATHSNCREHLKDNTTTHNWKLS
jgi:hypothetical protein